MHIRNALCLLTLSSSLCGCYHSGPVLQERDGGAGTVDANVAEGHDSGPDLPIDGDASVPIAGCEAFDVGFDLCVDCAPVAGVFWDGVRCTTEDNTCGCV